MAISSASSGAIPSATAIRHIWSMWPSRKSRSGSRSSVQNAQCSGPNRFTRSSSATRLRAFDASRMSTHMPRRRFSSASSTVVASWSERMPAATYASSARPVTPGAWPSTWLLSSSRSSCDAAPAMTPGKFIISATPSARGWRRIASMSSGSSGRSGDSKWLAGTHDGAITNTSSGSPSEASSIHSTPSRPSTLATSCGSVTTAVVPCGTTARANSAGVSLEDSMCTWASMKPGTSHRPPASTRSPS